MFSLHPERSKIFAIGRNHGDSWCCHGNHCWPEFRRKPLAIESNLLGCWGSRNHLKIAPPILFEDEDATFSDHTVCKHNISTMSSVNVFTHKYSIVYRFRKKRSWNVCKRQRTTNKYVLPGRDISSFCVLAPCWNKLWRQQLSNLHK